MKKPEGSRKTAYHIILDKVLSWVSVRHRDADGNFTPAGDDPARPIHRIWVPDRPTSDLGAMSRQLNHGIVVANQTFDFTNFTQSASYDLWITDISLHIGGGWLGATGTDPTAELAIQPIAVEYLMWDATDAESRWLGEFLIPGGTHISFNTPIKFGAGKICRSYLALGGATDLTLLITWNGFEVAV